MAQTANVGRQSANGRASVISGHAALHGTNPRANFGAILMVPYLGGLYSRPRTSWALIGDGWYRVGSDPVSVGSHTNRQGGERVRFAASAWTCEKKRQVGATHPQS